MQKKNNNSKKQITVSLKQASKNRTRKNARRALRKQLAEGIVGGQPGVRGNVGLSLTRNQFTATTPLSLWEVRKASSPGGMRVKGREMLGTLIKANGDSTFSLLGWNAIGVQPFYLNPNAFGRLPSVANIYEEYIFHEARIYFQSSRPTTEPGTVYLWTDYDIADGTPVVAAQAMANVSASQANVYSDQSMVALRSLSRIPRYFCSTDDEDETSPMSVLQGQIFAGITGSTLPEGTAIGNVICEYDVEMFTPCLEDYSGPVPPGLAKIHRMMEKRKKNAEFLSFLRQEYEAKKGGDTPSSSSSQKEKFNTQKNTENISDARDALSQLREVLSLSNQVHSGHLQSSSSMAVAPKSRSTD